MRWHTFFAATVSLLVMSQSQAHRLPEGVTTISYSVGDETVDIVHRLHVHDAELGLAELLRDPQLTSLQLPRPYRREAIRSVL